MNSRVITYLIYGNSLTEIDEELTVKAGRKVTPNSILSINITDHSNGMCATIVLWNSSREPFDNTNAL